MLAFVRRTGNLIIFALSLMALAVVAAPTDNLYIARGKIEQAKEAGAPTLTPMSLRQAESELVRAKRLVSSYPTQPLRYEHALEMLEYRVEQLSRVLTAVKQSGLRLDEFTAIEQVRQTYPGMAPSLSKNENVE